MDDTLLVAIGGLVLAALTYFAGRQHAERLHRRSREDQAERERRAQQDALASKMIDEFVSSVRRHYADGPYALALLGLEALGSDAAIRNAIKEMQVRSGSDPWSGQAHRVADIDLVAFFKLVREDHINFGRTTVEEVARRVRAASSGAT